MWRIGCSVRCLVTAGRSRWWSVNATLTKSRLTCVHCARSAASSRFGGRRRGRHCPDAPIKSQRVPGAAGETSGRHNGRRDPALSWGCARRVRRSASRSLGSPRCALRTFLANLGRCAARARDQADGRNRTAARQLASGPFLRAVCRSCWHDQLMRSPSAGLTSPTLLGWHWAVRGPMPVPLMEREHERR